MTTIDENNNNPMPDQDDEPTVELEPLTEEACAVMSLADSAADQPDATPDTPVASPCDNTGMPSVTPASDRMIAELREEIRCRFDTNSILQRGIDQLREKCDELSSQIAGLQDANRMLTNELASTRQELTVATKALDQKERDIQALIREQSGGIERDATPPDAETPKEKIESAANNGSSHEHVGSAVSNGHDHERIVLMDLDGIGPDIRIAGDGSFIIGSSSDCEVQIPSKYISRHHARLVTTRNGSVLSDLHSTNGTFVNARRISKRGLHTDDVVTFGKHRFRYEVRPATLFSDDVNEREYSFNDRHGRHR